MEVPRSISNPGMKFSDDEISKNLEDVRPPVESRFVAMAGAYMSKLAHFNQGMTPKNSNEQGLTSFDGSSAGGPADLPLSITASTPEPDRARGDQAVTPAVHQSGNTPVDERAYKNMLRAEAISKVMARISKVTPPDNRRDKQ